VLAIRKKPAARERHRLARTMPPKARAVLAPQPADRPQEGHAKMLKSSFIAAAFVLASVTGANALTINNTSSQEVAIGLDQGDKESVHKIPAGKSITFKTECDDHCGVTGPWNFSWWAKTGDTVETDGSSLTKAKEDPS
jgi:hypothetical protein